MNKKIKLEFAPGCFDSFDGTQEELDQLIEEIKTGFENGEFLEKAKAIDIDDILNDEDIANAVFSQSEDNRLRKLQ
jgi:hypothetical protein